jgi:putative hydrolase of the HAD superfamily
MNSSWDAVIFDYGGVLCHAPCRQDVAQYARSSGLDEETFYQLYTDTREYYGRSADGYSQHWKNVASCGGVEISEEAIQQFIEKEAGLWTQPNQETLGLARAVRAKGLRIAILSNMTFELLHILRTKFDWLDEFDVKIWSCEHGCAKPDEPIYLSCLKELDCKPECAIFFDDRQRNVDGATRLGIDAHVFESANQARSVVERRIPLT